MVLSAYSHNMATWFALINWNVMSSDNSEISKGIFLNISQFSKLRMYKNVKKSFFIFLVACVYLKNLKLFKQFLYFGSLAEKNMILLSTYTESELIICQRKSFTLDRSCLTLNKHQVLWILNIVNCWDFFPRKRLSCKIPLNWMGSICYLQFYKFLYQKSVA